MPKCQEVFPDKNFHPLKQQAELVFDAKTPSLTQKSCYSILENGNIQANTFQKNVILNTIFVCTATPEKCDFQGADISLQRK